MISGEGAARTLPLIKTKPGQIIGHSPPLSTVIHQREKGD